MCMLLHCGIILTSSKNIYIYIYTSEHLPLYSDRSKVHVSQMPCPLWSTFVLFCFILFSISSTIEFTCLCLFTTIFSISPEENFFFHIAPFTCLIFALSLLSIKNYIYYRRVANLSPNEIKLGLFYLAVHLFASIVKSISQINVLAGDIFYPTLSYITFHQFIDRIWMLTAAVIPIYLSIKFRNRVPSLVYRVQY